MKRSPLKRTTPLRNRSQMKRGGFIKRKPKPRVSERERKAREQFGRHDRYSACAKCGRTRLQCFLAGTKLEAHHVIAKAKVKEIVRARRLDVVIVWDRRNRMWLCGEPCHRRHTDRVDPVPLSKVSASAREFAKEFALTYVLESTYRLTGASEPPSV